MKQLKPIPILSEVTDLILSVLATHDYMDDSELGTECFTVKLALN